MSYRIESKCEWNGIVRLVAYFQKRPTFSRVVSDVITRTQFLAPELIGELPADVINGFKELSELVLPKFYESTHILPPMKYLKKLKMGSYRHRNRSFFNLAPLTQLESLVADFRVNDNELEGLTNLTELNLNDNYDVSENCITRLTNLTCLYLDDPSFNITNTRNFKNHVICKLPKLQTLSVVNNQRIKDRHVSSLTNLTRLNIGADECYGGNISDAGLSHLVSLKELDMRNCNDSITDIGLYPLVNLTSLNIKDNTWLTAASLERLTHLRELNITRASPKVVCGIKNLTNLTSLIARRVYMVDAVLLENLINLTHLDISICENFYDHSIKKLTNMVHLNIYRNSNITPSGVRRMKKLKFLEIGDLNFAQEWNNVVQPQFEIIIIPENEGLDEAEDFNYDWYRFRNLLDLLDLSRPRK